MFLILPDFLVLWQLKERQVQWTLILHPVMSTVLTLFPAWHRWCCKLANMLGIVCYSLPGLLLFTMHLVMQQKLYKLCFWSTLFLFFEMRIWCLTGYFEFLSKFMTFLDSHKSLHNESGLSEYSALFLKSQYFEIWICVLLTEIINLLQWLFAWMRYILFFRLENLKPTCCGLFGFFKLK